MRKKLLKLLAFGALTVAVSQTAYADITDCFLEKNYSSGAVNISGDAAKDERITIQIMDKSKSLSDLTSGENSGALYYSDEVKATDDGSFAVNAKFNATGSFVAYLTDSTSGTIKTIPFDFVGYSDYETAVNAINSATQSTYLSVLTANLSKLGFSINANANMSTVASLMCVETTNAPLDVADYEGNIALYNECLAMDLLNNSNEDNVTEYISGLVANDTVLKKYYDKHITMEEAEKYLTKVMSGQNITSVANLKSKIVEGVILTAVKYPDGYDNIKTIFNEYKSVLSLTSVSASSSVYSSLAGNEFSTISLLMQKYSELVGKVSSTTSGGGGGGGGGSTSTGTTGTTVTTTGGDVSVGYSNTQTSTNKNETVEMSFEDLNSVPWAYTAIAKLYDENIVNGESDTVFLPEHQVTREAFVKMIVSAMNLDNNSYGENVFSDVQRGAWYEKYVTIAKENALVDGIGNDMFGVGNNISRQDMAVMIYNAMLKNGYEPTNYELAFDDGDSVSDYAKQAVGELSGLEIISGVGDNNFEPRSYATRAQAAVIIYRALEFLR